MNLKWIGTALVASIALAQPQTETQSPKFEVISVRLNKSPDPAKGALQFLPGGRFIATDVPLALIIAAAWNIPLHSPRLTEAPGVKLPTDVYDIEATPEKGAFPPGITTDVRLQRMRQMLQSLLEDHFHLRVHVESREVPVYMLVIAKGGPKLEKSKFQEQDCGDKSPDWLSNPACHFLNGSQDRGIHGASITIAGVVEHVNNFTDRPALDKTGLTGFYNIQTEGWLPMTVRPPTLDSTLQPVDTTTGDSSRPTLFEVFEKLGLQLQPQKTVIDMFVIDRVETPGEN